MEFKYGTISAFKKGYAKVFFDENNIVSDWLPVLVRKSKSDKESWQLEANEHVVCLMDDSCNSGVILGAIPNDQDAPDPGEGAGIYRKLFSDGTLIEYNKTTKKLKVDVKGSLEAKTETSAKIEAGTTLQAKAGISATVEAATIELKGIVNVTGALNVSGIATIAGAMAAAGISSTGGLPITSTGDISTTGEISGSEVKAGLISLKNHKHPGIQPGAGITGLPQ